MPTTPDDLDAACANRSEPQPAPKHNGQVGQIDARPRPALPYTAAEMIKQTTARGRVLIAPLAVATDTAKA